MNVIEPWLAYKGAQWKQQPCNSNRASQLGGDCERELVYWRTRWRDAARPEIGLQIVLQEGEKHEREVLIDLQRAGLRVIEQQASLEYRELEITGHIDAVIVDDQNRAIPVDIKSMSAHIWDSIFFDGSRAYAWAEVAGAFQKKPWLRKYLAQITLYCFMRNAELGMFLCINKGTGALAQVDVPLDYSYAEEMLQRAARINAHVKQGTLPERIRFHEEICPRCPFYSTCLPEHVGMDPLVFLEDETIANLLEERETFADTRELYEKADERVKSWAKARPESKLSVGRWLLEKKAHGRGVRVDIKSVAG